MAVSLGIADSMPPGELVGQSICRSGLLDERDNQVRRTALVELWLSPEKCTQRSKFWTRPGHAQKFIDVRLRCLATGRFIGFVSDALASCCRIADERPAITVRASVYQLR
jgi:hypothetical protein